MRRFWPWRRLAERIDVVPARRDVDFVFDFAGSDNDRGIVDFNDLAAMNEQLVIAEAFEQRPFDDKLLNDETVNVDDIIGNLADLLFVIVNYLLAFELVFQLINVFLSDNVFRNNEFVAAVDDHAQAAHFANISSPKVGRIIVEMRAVEPIAYD